MTKDRQYFRTVLYLNVFGFIYKHTDMAETVLGSHQIL